MRRGVLGTAVVVVIVLVIAIPVAILTREDDAKACQEILARVERTDQDIQDAILRVRKHRTFDADGIRVTRISVTTLSSYYVDVVEEDTDSAEKYNCLTHTPKIEQALVDCIDSIRELVALARD